MKKLAELTIPVLVALTWGVLAIATFNDVGELAVALMGPSPESYGPAIEITPEPVSFRHALQVKPDHACNLQVEPT
jgi:hypothetical protein